VLHANKAKTNPDSVILVIFNLDLIITQLFHILHSASVEWLMSQTPICLECKYSIIIEFGGVYLADQSDRAVVSDLK